MVYQAITKGISVSVQVFHDSELRSVDNNGFVYRYFVDITNNSAAPVKLLSRKWIINDILSGIKEVEGEGVVGRQPIINIGTTYRYHSAAALAGKIGVMHGTYTMLDILEHKTFEVTIPHFHLISNDRLN